MTKEYKLDIFDLLRAIDRRDMNFYDNLEPDVKKAFAARTALRWTSCVSGNMAEHYILLTNQIVNKNFDDIREYPDLQYKLLAVCGNGKPVRHDWVPVQKGQFSKKARGYVAQFYPFANQTEIDILINSFTSETFKDFLHDTGCAQEDIKDLTKDFEKERHSNKAHL